MTPRARRGAVAAVMVAVAAACEREQPARDAADPRPNAARARPLLAPEPACPGRDFATFLAAFERDTAVQRRYTAFPLRTSELEEAPDEPRQVTRLVGRADARYPLFPDATSRAAGGIAVRPEPLAGGAWRVAVYRADSDSYSYDYLFSPAGDCWRLVRVDDESL